MGKWFKENIVHIRLYLFLFPLSYRGKIIVDKGGGGNAFQTILLLNFDILS